MNRDENYYTHGALYQRPDGDHNNHSPPPCLYMGRQTQSVYSAPSLSALDQPTLTDVPYEMPLIREDPEPPQPHTQQAGAYGDSANLAMLNQRSRYPLPFPWMKSTKSHAHTWRGQWAGNLRDWFTGDGSNGAVIFSKSQVKIVDPYC